MSSPDLWGIDPDAVYLFTPPKFLELPEGWEDAYKAHVAANPGETVGEAARAVWEMEQFRDAPRARVEGAPLYKLGPALAANGLRLQTARDAYRRVQMEGQERFRTEMRQIEASGLPETERRQKADEAQLQHRIAMRRESEAIYTPELQLSILQECVKGWENLRVPFTGKWGSDSRTLISAGDTSSIFWAIANETAFTKEVVQGFTSPPDSPPA